MKRLSLLAAFLWIVVGIYGILYNITYIDEAKYLIKGWLMATGRVGYYSTPGFFYQHMPGGLLWYGLGQALIGPSLLIARLQSFFISLAVLFFTYKLAIAINLKAKTAILPIMALAPTAVLYYSVAVPQSLAALALVVGFYFLFKQKDYLATAGFTLAFIIRENFLFTLIFYLLYQRRQRLKNLLLSLTIIAVFFLPGWPGIINVFKNFPGVSWLLPVSGAEKQILSLNFQQNTHLPALYLQAVKQFIEAYWAFLIIFIWAIRQKSTAGRNWLFLCFITGFNFLAHAWSAVNLSPRAIVPYFAYIFPLAAVIAAVQLANKKIKSAWLFMLILLAPTGIVFSSVFQPPNRPSTISILTQASVSLKPIVNNKQHIIWIAEPMSLYLAGKVSYYPLINHTNFYKPTHDTATVKKLGFWNREMLDAWLKQADLLVFDPDRLNFAGIDLTNALGDRWQQLATPSGLWPEQLQFYIPRSLATR